MPIIRHTSSCPSSRIRLKGRNKTGTGTLARPKSSGFTSLTREPVPDLLRPLSNGVCRCVPDPIRLARLLKKGTGSTTACACNQVKPLLVVVPVPFFSSLLARMVNQIERLNLSPRIFFTHVTSTRGSVLLAVRLLQSRSPAGRARWGLSIPASGSRLLHRLDCGMIRLTASGRFKCTLAPARSAK
jgi:hypothetical protein